MDDATVGTDQKCGFVAVIGLPNAGKSTLVNALVGAHVSIVAPKPQTTRIKVRGIFVHGPSQIVLIDTPGIFKSKERLHNAMVNTAWGALHDADVVCVIVDVLKEKSFDNIKTLLENLKSQNQSQKKCALILNKIDKLPNEKLLPISQELNDVYDFDTTFMISATKKSGIVDIKNYLADNVPYGCWHYDEDDMIDLPAKLMAAEFTREQVFRKLHQEIPHKTTVETESLAQNDNGSITIYQTIIVQRDNQKPILIGKGGQMIKKIGEAARKVLEESFGTRVHLHLQVKAKPAWDQKGTYFRMWGLEER